MKEIRVLLDAAVFRMEQFSRISPHDGFTNLDHMTPTTSQEPPQPTTIPEPVIENVTPVGPVVEQSVEPEVVPENEPGNYSVFQHVPNQFCEKY